MPLGEFALIDRYFRAAGARRDDVVLGVGDDGAILRPPAGFDLVAVSDTLVEGVHFPAGSPPRSIGHRALAVNLSDIAAMGAVPAWSLLALTLPESNDSWLGEFAEGFSALARAHAVALVGGDTTRGPRMVNVQVMGLVRTGSGLRRSGARIGDLLCVSGTPGDAATGLRLLQSNEALAAENLASAHAALRHRFEYPSPRVALGRELLDVASACIDVSDGLAGDIDKLLAASDCGATIDLDALPRSAALGALVDAGRLEDREALRLILQGGDDYELAFTVPAAERSRLDSLMKLDLVSVIGTVTAPPKDFSAARISFSSVDPARIATARTAAAGFDHFDG